MAMFLEVIGGSLARGSRFSLDTPGRFTFGRGEAATCRLPDEPSVSRTHFAIEAEPPEARLVDCGSVNGVWVNDRKIGGTRTPGAPTETLLKHGDTIRVGETVLRFISHNPNLSDADATFVIPGKQELACAPSTPPGDLSRLMDAPDGNESTAPSIPGFAIACKIGSGAAGDVWQATEESMGRTVAIKVMKPGIVGAGQALDRFQREIELTSRIRHPHVVDFIASGQVDGNLYLALEFMAGGNLSERLAELPGAMPPAEAARIMLQALDGMAMAHSHQIVHRDLKPSNILFSDGARTVAKISDLGLAKDRADGIAFTATGCGGGTPAYMAPEQITTFRHATATADVFSLAATFYELLCRRPVYNVEDGREYFDAILDRDIVPLTVRGMELPPSLVEVVDRGLRAEPEERYRNAGEMRAALIAVLEHFE